MRVFASSFHAWESLEENEGVKVPHGLVFPLAVVEAIGKPYGLTMTAEEHESAGPLDYDAVFISVLDSRCMIEAARHFRAWGMPLRRNQRDDSYPLVWAGGQGLHNPLPMANVYDLCVVGDAEEPLPILLQLWDRHGGDRKAFLRAASTVEGVFVPSVHNPTEVRIKQSVADDVTVTLRNDIQVSHNGQRRVEIARGCRYKCGFCSLGWRAPVRENSADDVTQAIKESPRIVHLQAGDAESHSGITQIREALQEHGGRDNGWTGRLDTTMSNPDTEIPGSKRYAFGVEGISHRLRCAVGKDYLTDERLIADTVTFLSRVEGDFYGRAAWHIIAGLPTERPEEIADFRNVILSINDRMRGSRKRNLAIHWQPFCPLPGTPMQWFPAGGGARRLARACSDLKGKMTKLAFDQLTGRTDWMAAACTILARCDAEGGVRVLEAMLDERPTLEHLREFSGTHEGALNSDDPLPWDFVDYAYDKTVLRRAYDVTERKLAELPVGEWRDMRSDPSIVLRATCGFEGKPVRKQASKPKPESFAAAGLMAEELLRKRRRNG